MALSASEEAGSTMSLDGLSNGQQRCQSSEALAEWRSSEQVENGTPSTSPPYWDSDDDEDAGCDTTTTTSISSEGPKPSELYGKYTWKIDKFSQINKRELRSNAFEVGGYKWYILIYPQGCDVCNHLSLFLCVANHDKLLPGWSHFAQFTIAVVNKDPKKSKYSDTLHRFWKKEHDWGWKKFMELSKVLEGFIDADTLIIKAQVQVIRERADQPFRCLDCQYRRELVRVYLTNVEQICRRFVEERRVKLGKLIEDKARWSSFCAFWLGMDQNSRRQMSREKSRSILKVVVKHFFIEKEVTSTLVMDSLYSGLKAIEGLTKGKKGKGKYLDAEEQLDPIVRLDNDMFVLVDDVLLLLERAALEPLPPKDEKGPQNRTKDGASGEVFNKDSIERDERRLTELGRRTIEIFVLAHILSKIEVSYQEAVALKRQEELIREEEAAWLAETEQKAKKAADKEKKSKKKQGKQKKNNRKMRDKGRDEKTCIIEQEKAERDGCIVDGNDCETEEPEAALEKPDMLEDGSDVSDSVDCVSEVNLPDFEDRGASPVNWDTDTSEMHPSRDTSFHGLNGLSAAQNSISGRNLPVMDDSSSTCSTDSVPSVAMNAPHRGTSSNHKNQKSPVRVVNRRSKSTSNTTDWASEIHSQPLDALPDTRKLTYTSVSCRATRSESQAIAHLHERDVLKQEVMVSQQRKLTEPDSEKPFLQKPHVISPPRSPLRSAASAVQSKLELKVSATNDPNSVKRLSSDSSKVTHKSTTLANSAETAVSLKADLRKGIERQVAEKPSEHSVSITPQNFQSDQVTASATTAKPKLLVPAPSRPLSAPVVPVPRPAASVVSMVPTSPLLARPVSAAGQLHSDPSPATHSYVPQSYRNAIVGNPVSGNAAGLSQPYSPSSIVNCSQPYPQSPSLISGPLILPQGLERMVPSCIRPKFSYGMMSHDTLQNGLQWDSSQRDSRSISRDHPSIPNEFQNFDIFQPVTRTHDHIPSEFPACTSGCQSQSALADEFPHLDIINDLLDDEHGIGRTSMPTPGFQSYSNGSHLLNRHFSFPGDIGMSAGLGPSTSSSRFERTRSYHDDIQHSFYEGPFDSARDMIPQPNPRFISGQMDGLVPNQWQMMGSDPSFLGLRTAENDPSYPYHIPDYSNMSSGGVNGYGVYRPPNGL